ncbi:hypothetical protein KIN20_006963 [Parelaphostrongylus tenuis]|uniref:Uncharacterized protein n=1 Tax=Parelaphostrongylus tenuis TaxID=148309 RepID=A0AAD5QHF4_PARTN|nr:hypothetical protein KIN20_006963 [Parelaphostrongylus tenuis]
MDNARKSMEFEKVWGPELYVMSGHKTRGGDQDREKEKEGERRKEERGGEIAGNNISLLRVNNIANILHIRAFSSGIFHENGAPVKKIRLKQQRRPKLKTRRETCRHLIRFSGSEEDEDFKTLDEQAVSVSPRTLLFPSNARVNQAISTNSLSAAVSFQKAWHLTKGLEYHHIFAQHHHELQKEALQALFRFDDAQEETLATSVNLIRFARASNLDWLKSGAL